MSTSAGSRRADGPPSELARSRGRARTLAGPSDRQFLNSALADVCLPRLADADDVAPVVAFLASDGARYVEGAIIEVNGGLLAHMPGLAGAPAPG